MHNYLYEKLLFRLESSMTNYNFNGDDLISVQLLAYKVDNAGGVKYIKPNLSLDSLGANRDLVDVNKTKFDSVFNRALPATMDLAQYGQPLQIVENNENLGCVIFKDKVLALQPSYTNRIKGTQADFVLGSNAQVFSNTDKYLVSVRPSTTISEGEHPEQKHHNIDVFTGDGGHVLSLVDHALTDTRFTRTSSNITKTIDVKGTVVHTSVQVNFEPVKLARAAQAHRHLIIPDPRIGTLDLETYIKDGLAKVYALGFYTKRYGVQTFYINQGLDSSEVVLRCLDAMLTAKYSGMTFYVHNLGRYDIIFILNILIHANMAQERYKLDIFAKDDLILSLGIKVNRYHIKLIDSYNILTHSLRDLGETFELDVNKGVFPYTFVDVNTIFYIGSRPDKSTYGEAIDQETYDAIPRNN